jgi:hypothetical protein
MMELLSDNFESANHVSASASDRMRTKAHELKPSSARMCMGSPAPSGEDGIFDAKLVVFCLLGS